MTMPNVSSGQSLTAGASSATVTGSSPSPEPFRFAAGAGVPEWAVGKTNQEVLAMAGQMAQALQTVQPTRNPTQPPVPQPVTVQQPSMPTQDDFTLDPVTATQRTLEYNYGLRVQPVLDQLAAQMAGTGRQVAAMQHADEFRRWSPEIDQLVANVPAQQRTAELYSQAVRLVKAAHLDELVTERANAKMAEMGVGDRTSGGGTVASLSPAAVDLTKLSPAYKAAMDAMGIGAGELHEFLGKTGQTMEQFVESANRNQVITDVSYDKKGRSQVVMDMEKMYPKGTKVTAW